MQVDLDIHRLDPDIVHQYLVTRDAAACGLQPQVAKYIIEVNDAHNLFYKCPSIYKAACALIKMEAHRDLSLTVARQRVADAISFFHSDLTITSENWNMYYADKMEQLASVALAGNDYKSAASMMEKAREYRLSCSANKVDPDLVKFKPQVVSADMTLERMGVTEQNVWDAWATVQEIIDKRELNLEDKARLKDEAARELGMNSVTAEENGDI